MSVDFEAFGEVQADAKGRVTLGKAQVEKGDRFFVKRAPDGRILLEPAAAIPARELDLWDDPELLETVKEGLVQYAAGETVDLGDFTQYADDAS